MNPRNPDFLWEKPWSLSLAELWKMTERNKAMVANQAIPDVEAAAGKIFMRTTLTPETPSPGITDNKNTPISANPNELQSGGLPKNNEWLTSRESLAALGRLGDETMNLSRFDPNLTGIANKIHDQWVALADLIRSENNGKIPLELANQLNAYRTTLITRQSEHIKIRARELSPEVELLSKVARGPFVIEHVSIGKPGGTPSILRWESMERPFVSTSAINEAYKNLTA